MRSLLTALLLASPAAAQWTLDPGTDLQLSDGDGEEVQALVRSAPDGSTWVSWYDSDPQGSPAFGYDVRIQRLAPNGQPTFPVGGLVVADRGFSSTQSYGMDVGPDGSAYLAFRDDRSGGVQITATRVTPDGGQPWGPLGVQLTTTPQFLASPKIAVSGDGVTVAWTQDINVGVARLDFDGSTVWPNNIVVPPPPDTTLGLSDMAALTGGDVGIAMVRTVGGFFGTRQLWVQKLSATGVPQWPGAGVALESSNSLQIGNFPPIAHDGAGGVVAAWYGNGPLQSYAGHLLSDGTSAYGAPKVELSTDASQLRVSPSIAYDADTGEAVAVWVETDLFQSDRGIYAQKLSSTGQRLWGSGGVALQPLGPGDVSQARARAADGGLRAVWSNGTFGNESLRAAALDATGSVAIPVFDFSSPPRSIDDLDIDPAVFDSTVLVWHDNRSGDNDVYAKSWAPSGALGPAPGSLTVDLSINEVAFESTVGPLGGTLEFTFDPGGGSTYLSAFAFATLGATALPFGSDLLYVDPTAPGGELLGLPAASGTSPSWTLPLPNDAALAGLKLYAQGAGILPTFELKLSDGLELYLGV